MRPGVGPCDWDAAALGISEFIIIGNVKCKTGNTGNAWCVNLPPRKCHPKKVDRCLAENDEV